MTHKGGCAHQDRLAMDHAAEAVVIMDMEVLQGLQGNPFSPAYVAKNPA